jgi:hypothetical protein
VNPVPACHPAGPHLLLTQSQRDKANGLWKLGPKFVRFTLEWLREKHSLFGEKEKLSLSSALKKFFPHQHFSLRDSLFTFLQL